MNYLLHFLKSVGIWILGFIVLASLESLILSNHCPPQSAYATRRFFRWSRMAWCVIAILTFFRPAKPQADGTENGV